MEAIEQRLPGSSLVGKVLFPILLLVALYYLYNFLFGTSGLEAKNVINTIRDANPDKGYITLADSLPAIYEGGEFTINGWIYINDYGVRQGLNKHVFSLGGDDFLTLLVYLGPNKSSLNVRVHTKESGSTTTSSSVDDLSVSGLTSIFNTPQSEGSLISSSRPCDIQSIDLQKWIQVTIALNNKTCDVYIDGKLARSCILPSFYKVHKRNFTLNVCEYNGFGGFVSNVSAYNYALNPEQVWRLYMAGPGPQYGFLDYLKSLFDPNALKSLEFPKVNVTA